MPAQFNVKKMKVLLIIYFGILSIGFCSFLEQIPVKLLQPDGSIINGFSSGDEYYVRLHDANNFTIIQDTNDGYYYYAHLLNDVVAPTHYRADQPIPKSANLQSGVYISKENYLNPEDAKLINEFINKIQKELSN